MDEVSVEDVLAALERVKLRQEAGEDGLGSVTCAVFGVTVADSFMEHLLAWRALIDALRGCEELEAAL